MNHDARVNTTEVSVGDVNTLAAPVGQGHLHTALAMAVPLEIMRLRALAEWDLDQLAAMLPAQIQSGADTLQFGGGTPGEIAGSFAAWTRTLAVLALRAEGGVDFAGRHWCADVGCRAKSRFDHAPPDPDPTPTRSTQ